MLILVGLPLWFIIHYYSGVINEGLSTIALHTSIVGRDDF